MQPLQEGGIGHAALLGHSSESSWAKERSWGKSSGDVSRVTCKASESSGKGVVGGKGKKDGATNVQRLERWRNQRPWPTNLVRGHGGWTRSRPVEQVCSESRAVVQEHVSMTAAARYIAVAKSTMYNAILSGSILSGSTWRYSSPEAHGRKPATQAPAGVPLNVLRGKTRETGETLATSHTTESVLYSMCSL
jgi:hypothetical protein